MATVNRDFVVKHGLQVATGITFSDDTVQTTAYDPNLLISPTSSSEPESPVNGQLYFNTTKQRLEIYFNGSWFVLAFYNDVLGSDIGDGNGVETPLITGTMNGGYPSSTYNTTIDGGTPDSLESMLTGGLATTVTFESFINGGNPLSDDFTIEYSGGIPSSPYQEA